MNKKYILLFIGIIVLFVIFIVVIFFQQNQPSPNSSAGSNSNLQNTQKTNQKVVPSVTFTPLSGSAKEVTRQFYNYYFATPENPLADGAYKNNPYLSDDFKAVLKAGYNNGNAPVFCPQNKRADITVGKEAQIYYNNQYMTQETISETTPGGKDLYRISLENQNGNWLIFDVNCL